MSSNSSSMVNDTPSDTTPTTSNASSGESTLIASPPSDVMSVLTSTTSHASESTPQMEHATSPCTTAFPPMRFVRPEDGKIRHKSCLKRSSSYTTSPVVYEEPIVMEPLQKNKRRCWECNVKISLTAVTCRCDYTFCHKHRYAEEHQCQFNFKSAAKRKLEEENPRVIPSKFARMA